MNDDKKRKVDVKKLDPKEFEIPETVFIRDIENRVFQGIVLQCLSKIDGISLIEGTFIDNILGRGGPESIKGIYTEQDSKTQSVDIKIEVNICYGNSIPETAEEIQTAVAEEITRLTGLHVASVHVVFKNVLPPDQMKKLMSQLGSLTLPPVNTQKGSDEYNDEF